MQFLAWYSYVTLIWSLKACMLFFFSRLTFGLSQERFVKALGLICGVTYLAMFLTITVSCHPIQLNWQVKPKPPERCEVRLQNFYVCTVLNVTTDVALLAVPLPMLWKLRIPIRKKITLALLLSSAVFIIAAAIVRIVMTLQGQPSALTINRWGVRETIAAIIAVNAPIIKPLAMKSFYTRGFKLSGPTQQRQGPGNSDSSKQSSDGTTKSKIGSSFSWTHRKPEAVEVATHKGSRTGSRANIGLPPQTMSRLPTILTPFSAELRDIERIDTRLDDSASRDNIALEDRSFERGDYFNSIDIIERGPGPPPVPIEIIDAQPLYIPPTPGSLVRHEGSQPDERRWSEQRRHMRWTRQLRGFGRHRHGSV